MKKTATSLRVTVPFAGTAHLSGPPKLSGPAFFSHAPQEQGLPPPQNEQNALCSAILAEFLFVKGKMELREVSPKKKEKEKVFLFLPPKSQSGLCREGGKLHRMGPAF